MALPQGSAQPTNDNSPPIHRWGWVGEINAVRETDSKEHISIPGAEGLGYSHSVRFADAKK
jgi:hypothetical protein